LRLGSEKVESAAESAAQSRSLSTSSGRQSAAHMMLSSDMSIVSKGEAGRKCNVVSNMGSETKSCKASESDAAGNGIVSEDSHKEGVSGGDQTPF